MSSGRRGVVSVSGQGESEAVISGHDPDLVQKHFFSSFAFYSFGSNLHVIKKKNAGARSSGESIPVVSLYSQRESSGCPEQSRVAMAKRSIRAGCRGQLNCSCFAPALVASQRRWDCCSSERYTCRSLPGCRCRYTRGAARLRWIRLRRVL